MQCVNALHEGKRQSKTKKKMPLCTREQIFKTKNFNMQEKKKEITTTGITSSSFSELYYAYSNFSMLFVYYNFHVYSNVCCGRYQGKG